MSLRSALIHRTGSPGSAQQPTPAAGRAADPLRVRTTVTILVCLAALGVLVLASLAVGSLPLSLSEVWSGLLHHDQTTSSLIVWDLRMPRTLLAVVAGAALALAGVVMQALMRNPLAEPGILGVNAGASLAVVLGMWLLGITQVSRYLWLALAGAGAAAGLVMLIARRQSSAGPTRLVLAGIALGASLSAITGTITLYDTTTFSSYRQWVVGSLEGRDATQLAWISPFLLAGALLALLSGHTLNALALGEE